MPGTDLTYQLITVDGQDKVLWSDGRMHPVVRGGDGDEGANGGGDSGGDSGEGAATNKGGTGSGDESGAAKNDDVDGGKVTFTPEQQAHIDKLLNDQFGKGAAKGAKEREAAIAEYLTQQGLSETDRLKAEKDAAEQRAQQVTETANQRLVLADAKVAAVTAGAKSDRVAALLKLVDLSDIGVDDAGNVDAKAIEKAVKKGLDEYPEFKAVDGKTGKSSTEMNGNGGKAPAKTLEDAVNARLNG